jgi:hypothetical protein
VCPRFTAWLNSVPCGMEISRALLRDVRLLISFWPCACSESLSGAPGYETKRHLHLVPGIQQFSKALRHAKVACGPMKDTVAAELFQNATEERMHADMVAGRIIQLGCESLTEPKKWSSPLFSFHA